MLASTTHTFAQLGRAIDTAFARWDHSHLHLFELESGLKLVLGGGEEAEPDTQEIRLGMLSNAPNRFKYIYDLGDDWQHSCELMEIGVDPRDAYGESPKEPVPIFGWGPIPDQYGRTVEQSD